jgi:hypothetical protein
MNWSPLTNTVCSYAWQMFEHNGLLYVVGDMLGISDGCEVTRVATWDGTNWKDLNFLNADNVFAAAFFDDQLIIGFDNSYYTTDSVQVNYIARTDFATSTAASLSKSNSFQFYPNPAKDEVTVSFPFSNNIITIYDLCGRAVKHFSIKNGNAAELNISSLHQGVYAVEIKDEKGIIIASEKLFKQ